jgi:DNA polymerase III sliding clamp (beta) subunit (PCNA family)
MNLQMSGLQKVKELGMLVEGKGSRFQIMGLSEGEFPTIPDFPEGSALELDAAAEG